jgi:large subunit ribosomal protein L27
MAHKKSGGSSKNGRDSAAQRLGVKRSDGQLVTAGSIVGKDHTLWARVEGHVHFSPYAKGGRKQVSIIPAA